MKTKILSVAAFLCLSFISTTAVAQSAKYLEVDTDAPAKNNIPFFYQKKLVVEAKYTKSIELPYDAASVNMTVSPWIDKGLGYVTQINMGWQGLFWRRSDDNNQWGRWNKILTESWDGDYRLGEYSDRNTGGIGEGKRLYFEGTNTTSNHIYMSKFTTNSYDAALRVNIGLDKSDHHKFAVGCTYYGDNKWYSSMVVTASGKVGIGVENPQNTLDVNGTIRAKEVRVETGWADFVFDKDYKLPALSEVKAHIDEHKHLPGIPSATEVQENGVGLADMTTKMMQKIEELTLYVIQQNEKSAEQQQTIEKLNKRIVELEESKGR
ncbi:MAG: hypothetical protein ACLVKO_02435 [Dysgonomonas sp.]